MEEHGSNTVNGDERDKSADLQIAMNASKGIQQLNNDSASLPLATHAGSDMQVMCMH